jgi:hypothetical protein
MTDRDYFYIAKCHPFTGDNFYVSDGSDKSSIKTIRHDRATLAVDRLVQDLIAEAVQESVMKEMAALGQAQEAYDAQVAAEAEVARLTAKAEVERMRDALEEAARHLTLCATLMPSDGHPNTAWTWANEARAALQGDAP